MSAPTGPREHGPIDGPVRNLLWRLRARLVAPPAESRVRADLDRLLSAAVEHAHEAPDAAAVPRPDPAGAGASASAPAGVDEPAATKGVASVVDISSRRRAVHVLGRVAAASVVVVSVATGVSVARDGTVNLNLLLGREGQPAQSEPATPGLAAPVEDAVQEPEPAPPAPDEAPADQEGVSADEAPADDEAESDQAEPSYEGESSGSSSDEGSGGSGDAGSDGAEGGEDAVEEPAAEDLGDEVLAAPPDDDVAGFGGPQPCDKADLADCVADDEVEDGKDRLSAEELARRRFGGGSEDAEDAEDTGDAEG